MLGGRGLGAPTTYAHVPQLDSKCAVLGLTDLLTYLWPIARQRPGRQRESGVVFSGVVFSGVGGKGCFLTHLGIHSQQVLVCPMASPADGPP